jgi:hypothetical protein
MGIGAFTSELRAVIALRSASRARWRRVLTVFSARPSVAAVSSTEHFLQDKRHAEVLGKPRDLCLDARHGFVALGAMRRVVGRRRDLHDLRLAPRHQLRERGSAAVDAALAPRARLAGAHPDRVEPGRRVGIAAEEMPLAVGLQEDLLHDILGVREVAAELAGEPVDAPARALDERWNGLRRGRGGGDDGISRNRRNRVARGARHRKQSYSVDVLQAGDLERIALPYDCFELDAWLRTRCSICALATRWFARSPVMIRSGLKPCEGRLMPRVTSQTRVR